MERINVPEIIVSVNFDHSMQLQFIAIEYQVFAILIGIMIGS